VLLRIDSDHQKKLVCIKWIVDATVVWCLCRIRRRYFSPRGRTVLMWKDVQYLSLWKEYDQ
jgi:hypothetical protein